MAEKYELAQQISQYPFEEAMERLERIVEELERGEISLEDAINLYQEGILLSRHCDLKLKQVEEKIRLLTEENGNIILKEFSVEEGEG
ncbi:MAG: exodeoxyribonuclease VII small subunit [Thermicanus sp.]|nr:exodeoxyribonuclease VII small subunit [Thermicanus sp.]